MKRTKNDKTKVVKHLKDDIKTFNREAQEDRKLIQTLDGKPMRKDKKSKPKKQSMESRYREHSGEERAEHGYHKAQDSKKSYERFKEKKESKSDERKESKREKKIEKVMREFKSGELHSGSKKGPKVSNPKQAIAIAISESKKKK